MDFSQTCFRNSMENLTYSTITEYETTGLWVGI